MKKKFESQYAQRLGVHVHIPASTVESTATESIVVKKGKIVKYRYAQRGTGD